MNNVYAGGGDSSPAQVTQNVSEHGEFLDGGIAHDMMHSVGDTIGYWSNSKIWF